jgi:peroxiredoxin Q/BCP
MKTILMAGLIIGSAIGLAGAAPLKVGDKAPEFTAKASDGSTVKLADYAGKSNVILYFYPKDDTPGCTKQACGIRDTIAELKQLDAVVLGVSFDSVESHKKFIEKHKLPFLLLADTDKKIATAYGIANAQSAMAPRSTFIINKAGKIAYINLAVIPQSHTADIRTVLADINE